MQYGDHAHNEDYWFHHLIKHNEVDQRGNPNFNAFKRMWTDPTKGDWAHEFSGRLHSVASSIISFAEEAARAHPDSRAAFRGIIGATVGDIRTGFSPDLDDLDVLYTPSKGRDDAHADLVKFSQLPELDRYGYPPRSILRALQRGLRFLSPGDADLTELDRSCGGSDED